MSAAAGPAAGAAASGTSPAALSVASPAAAPVAAHTGLEPEARGAAMHAFAAQLFPILRSITGPGVRQTLAAMGEHIPMTLTEVPTGTAVLDWTIPDEWTLREAYLVGPDGTRVIDVANHSLHLVNYSEPVRATMSLAELRPKLHALPAHPDWIPYRYSHWRRDWGFCLTQRQLDALPEGQYQVVIDSTLAPGSLTLGECVLPGDSDEEILLYAHGCHPSLANDNLAGNVVAVWLAKLLAQRERRLTYRFVFGPATIGSITWLALNEHRLPKVRHGLSLASLGDRGTLTYKRSRRGGTDTDRIATHVTQAAGGVIEDFEPYGYDERQFCSPGFDLPYGRLSRTPNSRYPEYHTSGDDLSFITPESLAHSLDALLAIVEGFEQNARYLNLSPKGEPRLGPRGLFNMKHGLPPGRYEHALLWMLNQSDGERDLLSIAERSKIDLATLDAAAQALLAAGLLKRL